MADRDVKLIIRAKNEATRAIDSVSDALKELNKSQEDTGRSASKADGLLSELGSEFSRLNKEIAGLNALSKVAGELGKVEKAVSGLESDLRRSAGEFAKYAREAEKATANTARLKSQTDQFRQSVEREEAALRSRREERRKANAELRKSETAYRRLQAAMAKQKGGPSAAARSAEAFLAADVEKARAAAERASAAFEKQGTVVRSAKGALKEHSAEVRRSEAEQERLGNATRQAAAETQRNRTALAQSRTALGEIRTAATGAAQSLGGVAVSQREITEASRQTAATLGAVGAELAAMKRFSDGGGGFTNPQTAEAIRRQREEVDKARASYEVLEARAQRLAAAQQRIGAPTRTAAAAQREAAEAARVAKDEMERQIAVLNRMPGAINRVRGLRGIFSGFYGESRQAMSMFQRMRGEILSLATAYAGLYGTIQNIGGVITAYQSLEAAQNRLGAVFNQNDTAVRNELSWLERQAARLGISFDTLSNQYSKFAVAARAANFESEATRKVFLSVAEAGRVNKLSLEQMSGIFLALEQMISKGKIQSEELRRQLGDRLPGAFNIMAKALGVTTAELDNMMKKGEVLANQSTLIKFADELDDRFGSQLGASLKSTTTLIGQFTNELFQAQLRVARGGFIESLNVALANLNQWFRSREGRDFFLSLGSALGKFVTVLAEVPKYFGLISFAVKAFIGLKLAQSFLQLTGGLRGANGALVTLGGTLATVRGGFSTFGTTLTRITATLGTASTAAMSLTRIIRLLGAAIMRVPMLALFSVAAYAITELLTGWAGGIDDATSALDEHERLLQEVISAYEDAKDKTEDWAKAVKSGTSTQIRAALVQLRSELKTEIDKVTQTIEDAMAGPTWLSNAGPAFRLTGASKEQVESLKRLADGLRNGAVDLDVFRRSVDDIGKRTNSKIVLELAQQFLEAADKIGQLKDASDQSEAALRLLSGEASEADEEILGLNAAANESADALGGATESVNGYAEALNKVKGMIPELADEMSKLADIAKLDEAYAAMMKNARTMGEIMQANQWYARARGSINERYTNYEAVYTGQRGTPQGAEMERLVSATIRLAEQMGLSAKDLLTAMSYETGGTFDPWKAGPTTQWGQHRGLIQWGEPQAAKYGVSATTSVEDQIRAVGKYLTDAGVKAGDGLLQIYAAINAGSASKIHASDANNGGAPGTVLDKVSGQMGGHQARADGLLAAYAGIVEKTKELVTNEQKANEERAKGEEATAKLLADTEFQIAQQQLIAEGKNREATIEEAIRRAKEQNKNLTAEQIAAITEATGKLWDMQNATAGVEAAEKRVNDLYQLRQELMQQIEYFQGQGELGKADALKAQLENVNAELEAAIAKAVEMWRAIGGPQADLAIAKLNTTKMGIADVGKEAVISGKQIIEWFTGALVNALKAAAQAIAEGKDAWEAFSTAFLQGIAEMLIEIGELILKQAILNALQGFFGGFGGGGGLLGGLLRHDGGRVGAGGHTRAVAPGWFAGAVRLHEGGVAGLRPNEVPAILEKGEVVDPGDGSIFRKMFGGEQQPPTVKVVNTFDSADVLSEGLNSPVGEQAFINVVKRNAGKVRQILGQ